jgi:hypothetical protein
MNRAFDVLNSKSKFGKGACAPISPENIAEVKAIFQDFKDFVLKLKTPSGIPLHESPRKTFVIGFLATFYSIIEMSTDLFQNSFEFILTFRFSQDHIETLFSKIRRMGGFCINPTVPHFKSSLKRLLCQQEITASRAANALDCDSSSSVFRLSWSKRNSPILQPDEPSAPDTSDLLAFIDRHSSITPLAENVLSYIAGYIVRSMQGTVVCNLCLDNLLASQDSLNARLRNNELTRIKDRGGLTKASQGVLRVLIRCEAILRQTVMADPCKYMKLRNVRYLLVSLAMKSIHEERPIETFTHNCPPEINQLPHSLILSKEIASKFFDIRLKHFNAEYNREIVKKGRGSDRSRLHRLIIFKHE